MIRMQKRNSPLLNQPWVFFAFSIALLLSRQWLCKQEEIHSAVCQHGCAALCLLHLQYKRQIKRNAERYTCVCIRKNVSLHISFIVLILQHMIVWQILFSLFCSNHVLIAVIPIQHYTTGSRPTPKFKGRQAISSLLGWDLRHAILQRRWWQTIGKGTN